ncbi:MAG: type III-B CRISPR module RAMP protein Cmr6 [Thermodesulfobacteriota bacterium]
MEFWDQGWKPTSTEKRPALEKVLSYPTAAREQLEALLNRQEGMAKALGAVSWRARSIETFTTGLGMEHPIENGFAFLDPYGLPYLPGSSIKGVLRRAAEELALLEEDTKGWSIPMVWWLFGFDGTSSYLEPQDPREPEFISKENSRWQGAFISRLNPSNPLLRSFIGTIGKQLPENAPTDPITLCKALQSLTPLRRSIHMQGALEFWDVIPRPPDHKLSVDIMNPHYQHYYQGGKPPGDWGSPIPIFFLTLPVDSEFCFRVRLLPRPSLPNWLLEGVEGRPRWAVLVQEALVFAFKWLGFGAKTAVGYGRMKLARETASVSLDTKQKAEKPPTARDVAQPTPAAQDKLAELRERIASFPSGKNPVVELDELMNLLGRQYKDPRAPELAALLWEKVKDRPYSSKMQKNLIVWELVVKGGAS